VRESTSAAKAKTVLRIGMKILDEVQQVLRNEYQSDAFPT
jgi:hypothetical protein